MVKVLRAKIVLVGDGGVGKSSFRRVWLGDTFQAQYLMTLGADFAAKEVKIEYGPTKTEYLIKYQIWDLAGQPRFKVVSNLYYRGAVAALCFFDITNPNSFMNVEEWISSFWKLNGQGERPLMLVGAKCDLRGMISYHGQVSTAQGIEYAKRLSRLVQETHGFSIHYVETSSKENVNIDETFRLLSTEIINSLIHKQKLQSQNRESNALPLRLP
ncbi:MAG: Rab family GTPase [Candidatus Thorarchaeota archaeon]